MTQLLQWDMSDVSGSIYVSGFQVLERRLTMRWSAPWKRWSSAPRGPLNADV